jgi:hypothetical protein
MSVTRTHPRRRSRKPASVGMLDHLEPRTLLSATLTTWALPAGSSVGFTSTMAVGGGKLFFSDGEGNIDEVTKGANNTVDLVIHPTGASPSEMVYANGHVYFSDFFSATVSELLPDGSVQLDFQGESTPLNLTVDTNGGVWFTTNTFDADGNTVSEVRRIGADGSITQQSVPSTNQYATYLASDNSGGMWLVEQGTGGAGSALAHVTVGSAGLTIGAATAISTSSGQIGGIARAGNGSLYLLQDSDGATADQVLHVTVSGDSVLAQTAADLPASAQGTIPSTLKIDSTGKLWFVELTANKIASYDAATGSIDEFATGFTGMLAQFAIVEGANGPTDVWSVGTDANNSDAPCLVDIQISQPAPTGFTVTAQSAAGTEDVALAAGTRLARVDGPAGGYTVSIQWSDGSNSAGKVFTGSDGLQYVGLADGVTKTFASAGAYSGTITIARDGVTKTATTTVNVASALTASQNTVLTPLVGRLVVGVVATFNSAASTTASQFTATINWGDGSSSGVVVRNPLNHNQFFVLGLHSYHASGTYSVVTTIKNVSLNETTTALATVTV